MRILRFLSVLWFCGLSVFSHSQISKDDIWIDVRTEKEFREKQIEGTFNITHTEITEKIATITTDLDAPIRVFCRSGRRSGLARKALMDMGYTNVTNEGGFVEAEAKLNKIIKSDL